MRGPMSVHILSNGFCQGCANELSWKQGDRVAREQMAKRQRVAMFKQGEREDCSSPSMYYFFNRFMK